MAELGQPASSAAFAELVAEGESEPVAGWDFSWLDGRATEERPSWGYSRLLAERMSGATAALDLQTGGGEVLAKLTHAPPVLAATESWPPNIELARRNLGPLGGTVTAVGDADDLPFPAESFDLVVSRHPTVVLWAEIARVLRPGGTYLAQQIGAGTNRELTEYLMGPQPVAAARSPHWAVAAAREAGLVVVDFQEATLRVQFYDVGAVVYFLRKVLWTVPDFTVERYRDRLARLHDQIQAEGPFTCYSRRVLIEARKPAGRPLAQRAPRAGATGAASD